MGHGRGLNQGRGNGSQGAGGLVRLQSWPRRSTGKACLPEASHSCGMFSLLCKSLPFLPPDSAGRDAAGLWCLPLQPDASLLNQNPRDTGTCGEFIPHVALAE